LKKKLTIPLEGNEKIQIYMPQKFEMKKIENLIFEM
jgi:hypothetical protein